MASTPDTQPIVRMVGIGKRFKGLQALDDVRFDLMPGEVHALVGENGAGKSTLVRILCGVITADSGQIEFRGQQVAFSHPSQARRAGIVMVPQEINLVQQLRVYENVFLGREARSSLGLLDRSLMRSRTRELLDSLDCPIDADAKVRTLSVAQQQVVAIAKALVEDAEVIILDEPTAAITDKEIGRLFDVIKKLKAKSVAVVYISHRLDEIFEIADCITVLRDGVCVADRKTSELDKNELISLMVGRELKEMFPKVDVPIGPVILEVKNLSCKGLFQDISFQLHAGEILGITGLMGAGRTEVAKAIFGAFGETPGQVVMNGKPLRRRSPRDAIRGGLGFVTEDRKREGLFMDLPIGKNIMMASLDRLTRFGFIDSGAADDVVRKLMVDLQVRPPDPTRRVKYLSGGNQQKTVVAKWLAHDPKIYILDEPTRGIDVGAKAEIHQLMGKMLQSGAGIILISSELPEVLGMADRIIVMYEGRTTGEFLRGQATQEAIMRCATGGVQGVCAS